MASPNRTAFPGPHASHANSVGAVNATHLIEIPEGCRFMLDLHITANDATDTGTARTSDHRTVLGRVAAGGVCTIEEEIVFPGRVIAAGAAVSTAPSGGPLFGVNINVLGIAGKTIYSTVLCTGTIL